MLIKINNTIINVANIVSAQFTPCPSRKSHPALKELQLERSSVILLHRPAHPYSDSLLHIYGPHLRSLCAHPKLYRVPNSARYRESRHASATGRPQPENSPAATPSTGSILLGDSLATLEELGGRSCSLSNRRPSSNGTGRVSSSIGDGNRRLRSDVRRSTRRFVS